MQILRLYAFRRMQLALPQMHLAAAICDILHQKLACSNHLSWHLTALRRWAQTCACPVTKHNSVPGATQG